MLRLQTLRCSLAGAASLQTSMPSGADDEVSLSDKKGRGELVAVVLPGRPVDATARRGDGRTSDRRLLIPVAVGCGSTRCRGGYAGCLAEGDSLL